MATSKQKDYFRQQKARLKVLLLELAEDKTVITHVNDGFDFLGCNVKWYKDKSLIKLSDKNYKSVITKIRGIIKTTTTLKQSLLIRTLNPIIRGWVNFQKYNVLAKVFERLNYINKARALGLSRKK